MIRSGVGRFSINSKLDCHSDGASGGSSAGSSYPTPAGTLSIHTSSSRSSEVKAVGAHNGVRRTGAAMRRV